MNLLHRHHHQRVVLFMAGILLAAQTLVFWHSHHGSLTPDTHCQICQYAQHHTPATNSLIAPVLALFSSMAISQAPSCETLHRVYQITIPSRAPPAFSFT